MSNKESFLCLCCETEIITDSAHIEVIETGDVFECMICEKCGAKYMSSEQMNNVLKKRRLKNTTRRCDVYDAYYDENYNWTEKQCCDPDCMFCVGRPDKHPRDCACIEG